MALVPVMDVADDIIWLTKNFGQPDYVIIALILCEHYNTCD